MFSMIVRLADSFGWDIPEWEALMARSQAMHDGGYSFTAMGKR